jgi:hypothetical protein
MLLSRRLSHGAMPLPTHAGDVAAEATWPWRDVTAESCCVTGVGIYDQSHDMQLDSGCAYIISMYNG